MPNRCDNPDCQECQSAFEAFLSEEAESYVDNPDDIPLPNEVITHCVQWYKDNVDAKAYGFEDWIVTSLSTQC